MKPAQCGFSFDRDERKRFSQDVSVNAIPLELRRDCLCFTGLEAAPWDLTAQNSLVSGCCDKTEKPALTFSCDV